MFANGIPDYRVQRRDAAVGSETIALVLEGDDSVSIFVIVECRHHACGYFQDRLGTLSGQRIGVC